MADNRQTNENYAKIGAELIANDHLICPNCRGMRLAWKNDFTYEEYGMAGEGMVHVYECIDCNASVSCAVGDSDA